MILVVMRGSDDEQDDDGHKTPFPREATEPQWKCFLLNNERQEKIKKKSYVFRMRFVI